MKTLINLIFLFFSFNSISDEINIYVVSDMNGRYGSTSYSKEIDNSISYIIENKPDFVISGGDHVAGQKKGLNYQSMWDSFHEHVSTPLKNNGIPFFPTPGNHDASKYSAFKLEREIYQRNFEFEDNQKINAIDVENFPLNYAYSFKGALFISLDATGLTLGELQVEWLKTLLEKNKNKYSPIIMYGHLPILPFAQNRESDYLRDKGLLELVQKEGVDLWISGHHHAYFPGRKNNLKLASLGCLGGGPRKLIGDQNTSKKSILHLKILNKKIVFLEALDAKNYFKKIKRETLPRSIGKNSKKIIRDDLNL